MFKLTVAVLLSWAVSVCLSVAQEAPAVNRLSADEKAASFRLMFNGRDLANWVHNGKAGTFTVKDGILVGDRTNPKEMAYWLSSEREYGDFELRLQYKIAKDGNSGIFIRAPHDGRASKRGMEIQILDDAPKDGQKKGKPGVGSTASIYSVVAPKAYASKPAEQWNELRILCDRDRVKVTLNGQVVNDASMAEHKDLQSRPRKGYIGLSAHTGRVEFRTVRLREIAHATSAPASAPAAPR